ncbi:galactokinase family protein [Corynebacterium sp.]|uniref:galactokinase n=1 Tax=Corynebacterium sp. TaxID=1720 RepID=UPI0025BB726A|nr:galactokinase family protein [Corynebacterium sp.]
MFHTVFGEDRSCEGVWVAPGRVNLIGEHVDYAGGVSLPFALPQCTAAAVGRRDDGVLRLVSLVPGSETPQEISIALSEVGPGSPEGWAGYAAGAVWAGVQDGVIPDCDGLDIALVSDVPLGAGLSSSAALECSVALAACELSLGRAPEAAETAHLVTVCMRAENEVVGASTGGLDQRSSFYGADGEVLAVDFLHDTVDLVPCDLESAGLALLIINTNAPHRLADGQYASRRGVVDAVGRVAGHGTVGGFLAENPGAEGRRELERIVDTWAVSPEAEELLEGDLEERTATAHRRIRHIIGEIHRTADVTVTSLKESGRLTTETAALLGQMMNGSHESLRDLFEVTVPELDSAQESALAAGALGARMTGGGFGGSVIALVPAGETVAVATAVVDAAASRGLPEPTFFTAVPSDGARRIAT